MREKNIKGITLVALVVTIIILLILAGVAITTLTQTGLFENAKQAKNKTENAQIEENTILGSYENKINEITGGISGSRDNITSSGTELLANPIIVDTTTTFVTRNLDFEISDISQYSYLLLTFGSYDEATSRSAISTQLLSKKAIERSMENDPIYLNSASGNNWSAAACKFKNSNTICIIDTGASNSGRKKFAIMSIEGIK